MLNIEFQCFRERHCFQRYRDSCFIRQLKFIHGRQGSFNSHCLLTTYSFTRTAGTNGHTALPVQLYHAAKRKEIVLMDAQYNRELKSS